MRAAVLTRFGGPEVLEVREVPDPVPADGHVVVRVTAAAVNNTDIWTREGAYGTAEDPGARSGWRGDIDFPRVQGGDIVGVVESVADDVDRSLVGRRVLVDPAFYDDHGHPVGLLGSEADGGFAERVAVAAARVHDVSGSALSDEELACLPVAYGTAMGMLERGGIGAGETVLVTGASGGVGVALVQLARARGAQVIALTTEAKRSRVAQAGAAVTLDRIQPVGAALARTAPGGLAAVLDVVGGPALPEILPRLRDGGRWVIAGAVGGHTVSLDLRRLYLHNIAVIGSSMHSPHHFDLLATEARRATFRPPVAARYDLADIHQAQREFVGRNHVGKIVIRPGTGR
ncbi:zinc-binding dehydrogenase [Ornithinicoccus halotolerans]|uniref:zinc-binding dehydrogenase n=1 Tax=Ornithinicoccus halotolerans TaxID=1748220 RepID=UPI0012954688|nr:zinc-binding dehydrogenase [Ornithinicoccus halotolerans]